MQTGSALMPRDLRWFTFPQFWFCVCVLLGGGSQAAGETAGVRHAFLACGADTRIVNADGVVTWRTPLSTRDGWVLPDGRLVLVVSKTPGSYPGGGVVEMTRSGQVTFEFKGTQSEVNTAQLLENGRFLVTEAGEKPRVLEVDRSGKVALEFPIDCQRTNHHMQSRMTRKLSNGNYLVPQLLDKVVREYNPQGKVVWEVPTPNWPFTAIRLANGNTLVNCTYGHLGIEVDAKGRTVWQISNADLPTPWIKDACGAQRLPNGNTVIATYGIGAEHTKLLEVTPDKNVVWRYSDPSPSGIHHVQILDEFERPLPGPQYR